MEINHGALAIVFLELRACLYSSAAGSVVDCIRSGFLAMPGA
jgi:hypothetical protein